MGRAYLFLKVHICGTIIAYFNDITNVEILPYPLHFSDCKLSYILSGNVYNRLLQVNAAIVRRQYVAKSLQDIGLQEKYGL